MAADQSSELVKLPYQSHKDKNIRDAVLYAFAIVDMQALWDKERGREFQPLKALQLSLIHI